VIFDVNLKIPSVQAQSLEEVAGVLEYNVGTSVREVDLGIVSFKEGTEGTEYGAKITSIKESTWSKGRYQMELAVQLNRNTVKSIKLLDETGNPLELTQGYSSFNDKTNYTFTLVQGAFPKSGRIIIEVYENLKTYELPFSLKNIALIGR